MARDDAVDNEEEGNKTVTVTVTGGGVGQMVEGYDTVVQMMV